MNEPRHLAILAEPSAMWAANTNEQLVPDIAWCGGILPVKDISMLTVFVSQHMGKNFLKNLRAGCEISFFATSVATFESYQYKGVFEGVRHCTTAEEEQHRAHMEAFADVTAQYGYNGEATFQSYYHPPAFAVTFRVNDVFEQTPKRGTGKNVIGGSRER